MENNCLENKQITLEDLLTDKSKLVHFIGLGGIGMSGLAKFLIGLGYNVSGSDVKDSAALEQISGMGGIVFVGHSSENIKNVSCIVASSAIKDDNPEIVEAMRNNIPIFHRSHILNALMQGLGLENKQISIGVAGTHGKTTTSGMLSLVFEYSGFDPSFVVGGKMPHLKTNSKMGKGNFFIAELDESDGTVGVYTPDVTVITNLEYDHPDHYVNGFEQILETFEKYINNLAPTGKIVINIDSAGNRQLISRISHPGLILYSTDENNLDADYLVKDEAMIGLNSMAGIYRKNEYIGDINLPIPGTHNISNALAAVAVGIESGLEFSKIADALSKFTGMGRRFQIAGEVNGAKIVDDYAHHPTEVKTTLDAAKKFVESSNKGRVVAIFQPHRYSRLSNLWDDFLESFNSADVVYLCDVYSAGESCLPGINSEKLSKEVNHKNVNYLSGNMEQIAKNFSQYIQPDDIILTMGAGDITKLGSLLVEQSGKQAGK